MSTKLDIYVFITITGSILLMVDYSIPWGIIRPVVSASVLIWFIRFYFIEIDQFLNHVIIIRT